MDPKERIIVALDVSDRKQLVELVRTLAPHVGCFKVGLELITALGAPQVVRLIHRLGGQVFLDGKFKDIPNTVARAARAASALGVKMFNVHASAGEEAMAAAVANKGNSLVLAVTVLTSLDDDECEHIYGRRPVDSKVCQFACDAMGVGVDGIICSPNELVSFASDEVFDGLQFVTPGVRPAWAAVNDQKRIMTPAEAIRAGAHYLVIGRPITNPPPEIGTPVNAIWRILDEIAIATQERKS